MNIPYPAGEQGAYTAYPDLDGNFQFTNVIPGYYTVIARLVPRRGSEFFYDCTWEYLESGRRVCVKDEASPEYRIGVVRSGIEVRHQEKVLLNIFNVQKLYEDEEGYLDETQDVTPDDSAPKEPYEGEDYNL